ncbi:MAG: Na+/H+ antiporter subunit E [Burkholderiaceae bacterium]
MNSTTTKSPGSKSWLAHPVLSLLLGGSWLALSRSLEPIHLLTALLLALGVPRMLRPFLGDGRTIHWLAALRLVFVVIWDIILANLTVARLVLGPMNRLHPAWLTIPLATGHAHVNALFASIITMTPGTVSAVVDEARAVIVVHALNCDDPQQAVAEMKERYEAALMRVFGVEAGEKP